MSAPKDGLQRFYVTFGMGTLFRGYHAVIDAANENIVRAWMNKRYLRQWSNVYHTEPQGSKPLQERAEELHYARAEDIS